MRRAPRVVAVCVVALLAAGCGQYAGVHASQQPAAAALQPAAGLQPPASSGPSGSPGSAGSGESKAPVKADDGATGPGSNAVTGVAGPSNLGQKPGAKQGSKGNASKPPAKAGSKGSGKAGAPRSRAPKPSGSPTAPQGAGGISRITTKFALHNATVLPAGFPFVICPVQGKYSYSDDYGAPRYAGGYHPHAGNDVFAAMGTPIVAPFDGYAVNDANTLGGNAVKVEGSQGYVYMAHLVAYGILGKVRAGTVVGFVGNTGDAQGTSPHDHFEWHPNVVQSYDRQIAGTNGAVDPFPYLKVVCPAT